ncbi:T9SS type A sorting domain-containing protein [Taibaiella lutea]|uniref:T9SS type A sorting domain-containing protein n=1 Tax=Taibaiella lutea TaxID=2608001 RepID=A0A5M6CDT1_9BACT|nr:T9SS type A sorting domain-containing protein [Taibaiella lutea]KAA5533261.1 T9SS type A sorting domain-containing protein [Taibaiella lutea]
MKRFYTTMALLGALVTSASAQTIANVSGTLVAPLAADANTPFNIPCTDSFEYEFIFVNQGPGTIGVTDTAFFITPFAGEGLVNYYKPTAPVAANDTLVHFSGKMAKSQIKRLINEAQDDYVFAPFTDGNYFYPAIFVGFSTDTTILKDNDGTDDGGITAVKINCATAVKDVNFSKSSLNIFPNPANNQISFTNEFAATTVAFVKITDLTGRVVKTMNLGKQNAGTKTYNVDLSGMNNGMYYIELITDETRSISKFTKN